MKIRIIYVSKGSARLQEGHIAAWLLSGNPGTKETGGNPLKCTNELTISDLQFKEIKEGLWIVNTINEQLKREMDNIRRHNYLESILKEDKKGSGKYTGTEVSSAKTEYNSIII